MPGPSGPIIDLDFSTSAIQQALNSIIGSIPSLQAAKVQAAGAINPHTSGNYVITAGSAQALTLAAPTPGVDDGVLISVFSTTAFAHTLTATGLIQGGVAAQNVATFAANPGSGLTLQAYNGKWVVRSSVGIALS